MASDRDRILAPWVAVGLLALGAAVTAFVMIATAGRGSPQQPPAQAAPAVTNASFTPPEFADIPEGPLGDSIRRGRAFFSDTGTAASDHVGNAMACRNCHLDEGRAADSAPMWGAWVVYPQFRKKTGTINTMADRIVQCFRYSMNAPNSPSGKPPAHDSDVVIDLEAYFHWLATGAPTGKTLEGAGFKEPPMPEEGYDPQRGKIVFEARCSACHGADGQGATASDGTVVYPPLWGPRSFNWGAGMARIDKAASFIKWNMPLGEGGSLSDAEAWDVAAYVDSHERPKDPRQTGTVAQNAEANFAGQKTYYGKTLDGRLIGTGVAPQR